MKPPAKTARRRRTARSGSREQLVAPVERRPQRLVARQRRAAAAGEQAEAIVEAGRELFDAERGRRAPPPARSRAGCRRGAGRSRRVIAALARVRREARLRRARPRHEQLDRGRVAADRCAIGRRLRRHLERRHAIDVLARRAQRLAAGREDARVRTGAQQRLGHARRRLDHVLAVVEHEQELLAAQRRGHALRRAGAGWQREPERGGDRDRDQLGIGQRRQLGDPDAVGVVAAAAGAATSSASRVLPTPPAPISVTSRWAVTSAVTSASSASRPISSDVAAGRFEGARMTAGVARAGDGRLLGAGHGGGTRERGSPGTAAWSRPRAARAARASAPRRTAGTGGARRSRRPSRAYRRITVRCTGSCRGSSASSAGRPARPAPRPRPSARS